MPDQTVDQNTQSVPTVSLGGRSFAIAPLRLGRMKKLPRELALVMRSKEMAAGALPDEPLLDAYAAIVTASILAATEDPAIPKPGEPVTAATVSTLLDGTEYFRGCAELAVAAAAVMKLSFGDDDSGEARGPATSEASRPSTSAGSTP